MIRQPPRSTPFPTRRSSDLRFQFLDMDRGDFWTNLVLALFFAILMTRLGRSEEHTSELQSHSDLVCRLLLEKKKTKKLDSTTEDHNRLHYRIPVRLKTHSIL